MNKIDKDVISTINVINRNFKENYDEIFFASNEMLYNIFSNFSVSGKDVLTVLASGDQAFHCFKNGAKSVDLFDINPLTFYYYYLRVWTIKYSNQFYPNRDFNSKDIKKLLRKVSIKSDYERDAYEYWKKLIEIDEFVFSKIFYDEVLKYPDNQIDDLSLLKKRFKEDIEFYNIDITKYFIYKKKYDVIITSNISEYYNDTFTLVSYWDNLKSMLNENGIIVSSNVIRSEVGLVEKLTFEDTFTINPMSEDIYGGIKKSLGYIYKRI